MSSPRTISLDESVHVLGPLAIHHVQNTGIAFGFFSGATSIVTIVTAVAVVWMLVFFARSGARHPVLPAALGLLDRRQHLEPRRPRPPRPRHGLHRPLATGPRSTSRTASSSSASPSCSPRSSRPTARRGRRGVRSTSPPGSGAAFGAALRGGRAARPVPRRRTSARAPRRSVRSTRACSSTASRGRRATASTGGEAVDLLEPERAARAEPPPAPRIAWEDEHLLVVDKPAGLVVHPAPGMPPTRSSTRCAGRIAGGDPERAGIVHRLDRDTSGLLVLARSRGGAPRG